MNIVKSLDYFQPSSLNGEKIHIIGCGSIGGFVAENLARFGITKINLYDFDFVEDKNIVNQIYTNSDVGKLKVECLKDKLLEINPEIKVETNQEGWSNGLTLDGYVFLAVDSIKTRKEIVDENKDNPDVLAMFDFRTGLTDGQHFATDWYNNRQVHSFINSMDFTDEDAKEATPVSACGVELCVCTTTKILASLGVQNFINFINNGELNKVITMDLNPINITTY